MSYSHFFLRLAALDTKALSCFISNWADPRVRCTNYLEQQQGLFTGRGANGGTRPVRTLEVLAAEGATSNYCVLADLFGRGLEFYSFKY